MSQAEVIGAALLAGVFVGLGLIGLVIAFRSRAIPELVARGGQGIVDEPGGRVVTFRFQARDCHSGLSYETWESRVLRPLDMDNQQAMTIALSKMAFEVAPDIGDLIENGFIPASSIVVGPDGESDPTAVRMMRDFADGISLGKANQREVQGYAKT